jgi:hypothetical protein
MIIKLFLSKRFYYSWCLPHFSHPFSLALVSRLVLYFIFIRYYDIEAWQIFLPSISGVIWYCCPLLAFWNVCGGTWLILPLFFNL